MSSMSTITNSALLRLLQLSSATLPVGGYAFSQGLEYAVETGWVNSAQATQAWLHEQLQHSLARVDLPIIQRQMHSLRQQDLSALNYWNQYLLACRETKELHLTDIAMGEALQRLLRQLDLALPDNTLAEPSFLTLFCFAAHTWGIDDSAVQLGYIWAWLENQVSAATKLVPLGQTQAQQILSAMQVHIDQAITLASTVNDDEIGASMPALSIASANHETQYTRLFRS